MRPRLTSDGEHVMHGSHLDHCGALPVFTEMCGYHGPVIMSAPTRAVAPVLLEGTRNPARVYGVSASHWVILPAYWLL